MNRQIFKKGLVFLAVLSVGIPVRIFAQDEISKKYHKEYPAPKGTILEVSNKYGDLNFQNWDKNQVVIDVRITVDTPDEEYARKMLDYLDVVFSQDGNTIRAETVIDSRFSRSGWTRWGREGKRFSIDYTIHAPAAIDAQLNNKYGDMFVSRISGHAVLSVKYGNLKVNHLDREDLKPLNLVTLGYSKGVIDEAKWLKMELRYSKLDFGSVQALAGETSYSKLSIETGSSLVLESKYDEINLGALKNLVLDIAYGKVKAETISSKVALDSRYTSVHVDHIPATFKSIQIDNKYGGLSLGIDNRASYSLSAVARYCKISVPPSPKLSSITENTSATFNGIVGNQQNPKAVVKISTAYGGVKLQ